MKAGFRSRNQLAPAISVGAGVRIGKMSEPEPESELNMQSWLKDSKRKEGERDGGIK